MSRTIPTMLGSADAATTDAVKTPVTNRGTIATITGCMFSGKTTQLFRQLEDAGRASAVVFKHAVDTRYSESAVVAHTGRSMPAIVVRRAGELCGQIDDHTRTVAIDEGHFFDDGLVGAVQSLAGRGVSVMVTMLDRDSWGRVFPLTKKLNAIADEMVMLHGDCARCQRPASRTQRLTPIIDGEMVGGAESYEPRCLECWRAPVEPPSID